MIWARGSMWNFFESRLVNGNDREIVERCWDMKNLNYQYSKFIEKWETRVREMHPRAR